MLRVSTVTFYLSWFHLTKLSQNFAVRFVFNQFRFLNFIWLFSLISLSSVIIQNNSSLEIIKLNWRQRGENRLYTYFSFARHCSHCTVGSVAQLNLLLLYLTFCTSLCFRSHLWVIYRLRNYWYIFDL